MGLVLVHIITRILSGKKARLPSLKPIVLPKDIFPSPRWIKNCVAFNRFSIVFKKSNRFAIAGVVIPAQKAFLVAKRRPEHVSFDIASHLPRRLRAPPVAIVAVHGIS